MRHTEREREAHIEGAKWRTHTERDRERWARGQREAKEGVIH